jgi:small-conductance mechanosensitive channel
LCNFSLSISWLARLAQLFKRSLIRQILNRAPKNCDKIKLIDRIIDGMVLSVLLVKILDYLSVETGIALGSIFAVGSTGTLIISLGSQEIAKGVVNGVEMAASDRFYEGDNVHFGDGTQGYIVRMGELDVLFGFCYFRVPSSANRPCKLS